MPTLQVILPRLHPAQRQIKREARRFNVVNCGRRFGKSTLGMDVIIAPALEGFPVAWFSPDYKSLLEVWREVCRCLRSVTARRSEQEKRIELITGGVIEFWSLDADPECSRGRKYKRVVVDEAAKVRHLLRAWTEAIRANLADFEGDAWFFSTPKGRNDYWELFQRGKDARSADWVSWKMPTGANPYIKPSEIDAMRRDMGPRIAGQEIDAEFLEVAGRYFDEYEVSEPGKESAHEIYSFPVPAQWEFVGGMDWGKANPFCFLLSAWDARGNGHVIDECYSAGLSNDEQATEIRRCLERNQVPPSRLQIVADPSIFPPKDPAKRVGRYTVSDFEAAGLRFSPAINDRINGWTRLKEMLRDRDPQTRQAKLRIFKDKCPNLVRTMPLMVSSERHPEDLDTSLEDHSEDTLRYLCMTRVKASEVPLLGGSRDFMQPAPNLTRDLPRPVHPPAGLPTRPGSGYVVR